MNIEQVKKLQKRGLETYHWHRTELDRLQWKDRIKDFPSFRKVFNNNYNVTKPFCDKLFSKIHSAKIEDHAILSLDGETGSGKSSVSIGLCLLLFPELFSAEFIVFNNNDLIKLCESIPKKMICIQDEEPESVGMGSYREAMELKNIQEIARKHQLSIIFCSPSERIHDTAHFRLEVIEKSFKERVVHLGLRDPKTMNYLGYIILPVPSPKNKVYLDYIVKKDAFIKQVLSRQMTRLDLDEMIKKVGEHQLTELAKNKSELKTIVMEIFPSLTTQETSVVTDRFWMMKRSNTGEGVCKKCGKKGLRQTKKGKKCYICGEVENDTK